jgi:hypothetical protein
MKDRRIEEIEVCGDFDRDTLMVHLATQGKLHE